MSKVDDRRQEQVREAERMNQRAQKEARSHKAGEKRGRFKEMMSKREASQSTEQTRKRSKQKQSAKQASQTSANHHQARASRQGTAQASNLARALHARLAGEENVASDLTQEARAGDDTLKELSNADIHDVQENEREHELGIESAQKESQDQALHASGQLRVDADAKGQKQSESGAHRDSDGDTRQGDAHDASIQAKEALVGRGSASAEVLTEAYLGWLKSLVSKIAYSIRGKGSGVFEFDFDEGFMGGGKLRVDVDEAKSVKIELVGVSENDARLFQAGVNDLSRALRSHGLSLRGVSVL